MGDPVVKVPDRDATASQEALLRWVHSPRIRHGELIGYVMWIPRDQHRLIFEKFGRADVPGGSKPGSGLGS